MVAWNMQREKAKNLKTNGTIISIVDQLSTSLARSHKILHFKNRPPKRKPKPAVRVFFILPISRRSVA